MLRQKISGEFGRSANGDACESLGNSVRWRSPACIVSVSQKGEPASPMSHTYDIFWMTKKGPQWVTSAPDIETAKAKIKECLKNNPGRYLIFNLATQERILIEPESKG